GAVGALRDAGQGTGPDLGRPGCGTCDAAAVLGQSPTTDHGGGDGESAGGQCEAAVQGGSLHRLGVRGRVLGSLLELGAGGADHLGRRPGAAGGEELGGQAGVVPELGAGGLAVVPLLLHQPGTTGDLATQARGD